MGNFAQQYLGKDFEDYLEYLNNKAIEEMFNDLEKIDDRSDMSIVREKSLKNVYGE